MDRSQVGIVIPALNEADTITDVVKSSKNYGVPIVVDDGSTDATANLAKQSGAVVVSHFENVGYDRALNSGFFKAAEIGCEIVITVDADGQHNPLLIQRFIDTIDARADGVYKVRICTGRWHQAGRKQRKPNRYPAASSNSNES